MFLEIKGIKKSFGAGESRVDVLKGIDLEIEKGEFCVLLGPSGSGKSTLLNIIGGIDGADAGSITIQGERLEDMKEKKLSLYRRKHLGYIFQMYNLNCLEHWDFMNISGNFPISFPEASSRELPLAVPL